MRDGRRDPTIARFTQADTIVPEGVQGLDRYAYVSNNPARYSDPSGHWECESADGCDHIHAPGLLSPAARLKNAERRGSCAGGLMPECTQQHDELIDDIETYMYLHPEHKINADDFAGNDFLTFLGLREEYWMGRCMESGACSAIGNRDVQNLMDYYDFHLPVTTTVFDPARIDWTATGLDGAGLVLSVVALSAAPQAAQGYLAASRTAGAISMGRSFAIGDNAGGWLSFAGYAPVPIGTLASGASVFRDVSAGFYDVPYAPPVPR